MCMCAHVCRPDVAVRFFVSLFPPHMLRQSLLLNWELTILAAVASHLAPETSPISASLTLGLHMTHTQPFTWVLGTRTPVLIQPFTHWSFFFPAGCAVVMSILESTAHNPSLAGCWWAWGIMTEELAHTHKKLSDRQRLGFLSNPFKVTSHSMPFQKCSYVNLYSLLSMNVVDNF